MTHGLEGVLGEVAWQRLPRAVQARFGDPAVAVDYVGEFEIVRASVLGRLIASLCKLVGTPVVPRTGSHVPAVFRVGPTERGIVWKREYQWPDRSTWHFRVPLPTWLSPGTTHVEHLDEAHGWFRFTMTVTHPIFGEPFYQTGRFHAAGG
jgi:hypothetical protein